MLDPTAVTQEIFPHIRFAMIICCLFSLPSVAAEPYPIHDIGVSETWNERSMAYLVTDMPTSDPDSTELQARLRWAFSTLDSRYPTVSVFEARMQKDERYTFLFDLPVADWSTLTKKSTKWDQFLEAIDLQAVDLTNGDIFEAGAALSLLARLGAGTSGSSATAPIPPHSPSQKPILSGIFYTDADDLLSLRYTHTLHS